jgi:hypothetical protein
MFRLEPDNKFPVDSSNGKQLLVDFLNSPGVCREQLETDSSVGRELSYKLYYDCHLYKPPSSEFVD